MNKEKVIIPRATLDIFKYEKNGLTFYEFDATECQPPEPMVNTIVCLKQLKNENDRLVVTYFHEPTPLYEKISSNFAYETQELESGDFRIVFRKV
jgi:uncharacterized protein (DUF2249 family)